MRQRYAQTCITWGALSRNGESVPPPIPEPKLSEGHISSVWRLIHTNVTPFPNEGNLFLFTYTWER